MRTKYDGIIFDFNGTLFWDTPLHNRAWNLFLAAHDIHFSDAEFFSSIHGRNNRDLLTGWFHRDLSDTEIQAYVDEKESLYRRFCLESGQSLAPGLPSFLDYLQEKGIPFTIATASDKQNVDFFFEHLGIGRWFDYEKVVYNNGRIRSKPDPEIYRIAMSVIGTVPDRTIVFEDAIAGLQAARNAGAGRIIAVNSNDDDYSSWPDCQVIRSFDDVNRLDLFG